MILFNTAALDCKYGPGTWKAEVISKRSANVGKHKLEHPLGLIAKYDSSRKVDEPPGGRLLYEL